MKSGSQPRALFWGRAFQPVGAANAEALRGRRWIMDRRGRKGGTKGAGARPPGVADHGKAFRLYPRYDTCCRGGFGRRVTGFYFCFKKMCLGGRWQIDPRRTRAAAGEPVSGIGVIQESGGSGLARGASDGGAEKGIS